MMPAVRRIITGRARFSLAYVTTATDANSLTTYTSFTAQSIGAADPNRKVIIGVVGRTATATLDFSRVTIGGVQATLIKKQLSISSTTMAVALYGVAAPTGTTADVVVTFNEASLRCAIAVWRLVTANMAPFATASSGVDPNVLDLTIPPGAGVVVFGAASQSGITFTPTGYTENVDAVIGGGTLGYTAGTNTTSVGPTTIRITNGVGATDPAGVSAAWGT